MKPDATLRDLIIAVRADEMKHRDVNHAFADRLDAGRIEAVEPEKVR